MRSGALIVFPALEQAELNRLMGEIYVARITQEQIADWARAALDILINKRELARAQLGTDDPAELARRLRECKTEADRAAIDKKLSGVRLLPLDRRIIEEGELVFNQFPQILAYWRSKGGPHRRVEGKLLVPRLERFAETYL